MKRNKSFETEKKWNSLVKFVTSKFGDSKYLDLQAVLFLIGVNELGQGYKNFKKDEKVNLLHIAICKLLSKYDYYEYAGRDKDGWPHWKTNTKLPRLKLGEQTALTKEAAILYFEEAGIEF